MHYFSPELTTCSDWCCTFFFRFSKRSLLTMPSHGVGKRCLEQVVIFASEHLDDGCKTIPLLAVHIGESFDVCFGK